jgi:hypothetical protein
VNVPFEPGEESEIVGMIADTETFADVLVAAEALYKYCKEKQQEETKTPIDSGIAGFWCESATCF